MDTSETGLEKIIVDWLVQFREKQLTPSIEMGYVMTVEENGKEYCILTEKGTELYKTISTQETAGSTQEMLSKRANKFGKGLG